MNCFQLIDCNSGEVCEVGANAVAPSLREFLYPAVREGTGLYKGLFYRIACFDGRQGACFQVLWHGEGGEELLDCFVGWAPGQEMVRDKLRECCLVRALGIDWEALEPDDRFAAVLALRVRSGGCGGEGQRIPGVEAPSRESRPRAVGHPDRHPRAGTCRLNRRRQGVFFAENIAPCGFSACFSPDFRYNIRRRLVT